MALEPNNQWPEPVKAHTRTLGAFLLSMANGLLISASVESFSNRELMFLPLILATLAIHGLELAHTALEVKNFKNLTSKDVPPGDEFEKRMDEGLGTFRIAWAIAPIFTSVAYTALIYGVE
jgi:hypothetical protein